MVIPTAIKLKEVIKFSQFIYILLILGIIIVNQSFAQTIQNQVYSESEEDCCFDLLPVKRIYERISFEASSNSVMLEWATSKEWESSHFEIERAENNKLDFKQIGSVNSVGWSTTTVEYVYKDYSLINKGERVYYRIKQVDLNGNFEYGKVFSIIIPNQFNEVKSSLEIFPNPYSSGELKIVSNNLFKKDGEVIQVKVMQMGSVLMNDSFPDLTELNLKINTLTNRLPKGLVIIELRWKDKFEILKLIVN